MNSKQNIESRFSSGKSQFASWFQGSMRSGLGLVIPEAFLRISGFYLLCLQTALPFIVVITNLSLAQILAGELVWEPYDLHVHNLVVHPQRLSGIFLPSASL